jgi:hypothetical protein
MFEIRSPGRTYTSYNYYYYYSYSVLPKACGTPTFPIVSHVSLIQGFWGHFLIRTFAKVFYKVARIQTSF